MSPESKQRQLLYSRHKTELKRINRLKSKGLGYFLHLSKEEIKWIRLEFRKLYHKTLQKTMSKLKKDFITEYLTQHPCSQCGEKEIVCLEFHHIIGDKLSSVPKMCQSYGLETIKKEIEKCIILCGNCHKKLHIENDKIIYKTIDSIENIGERKRRKEKHDYANKYKSDNPCPCGETNTACLVFHHNNPKNKIEIISELYSKSWERLKKEITKCSILCTNCHKKFHHYDRLSSQ